MHEPTRIPPLLGGRWIVTCGGGILSACDWELSAAFADWAAEIVLMKRRLGTEHVWVGTDGGGNLPDLIEGYRDVRDLAYLALEMRKAGLSRKDLHAFFGGNALRVMKQCIG